MVLFFIIIVFLFVLGLKSSYVHSFDKNTVIVLKPFLALSIVFHHLHGQSVFLHEFLRWGSLIVAIFFFISGYGLSYSLKNKPNYFQNFFVDRILLKLMLPYILALTLELSINWQGIDYSLYDHFCNSAGPSLLPNDWFMFALFYCYLVFFITGNLNSDPLRLLFIFLGILSLVLVTFFMGFGRHWWASLMAFPIGAIYQYNESAIIRIVATKQRFFLNNLCLFLFFGLLILLSAIYKYQTTTILAYSLLPFWIACIFSRINLSKMVNNKLIIWSGNISFEVFLVHGIIISFLNAKQFPSGIFFVATTLIVSVGLAYIIKYITMFVWKLFPYRTL